MRLFQHFTPPSICLHMIVKNESHVIERALNSVKSLIKYWIIVDTGSTDDTREKIQKIMEGVPGELHERPWVGFGHNRTEALHLAKPHGDYLLVLDADDWLEYDSGFTLPEAESEVYTACWEFNKSFQYTKPLLVKSSLPWYWKGVFHEYLTMEPAKKIESEKFLSNIRYVVGGGGARSLDPKKSHHSAMILEQALREEPENSRYAFYLAESYRESGQLSKAIMAYQKFLSMPGWDQEVYWALIQMGLVQKQMNWPWESVSMSFFKAYAYRAFRAEAVYFLAELYNEQQKHALAYALVKGYMATPKKHQAETGFCLPWVDAYGLLFQLSISAFYVGEYKESLDLNDALLSQEIPANIRKQVEINRQFPIKRLVGGVHEGGYTLGIPGFGDPINSW